MLAREASKIRVVHNKRGEVGNTAHDALDDRPGQCAAVYGVRLPDDRADAIGSDDRPYEECDTRCWHAVRLNGE